MSIQDNATEYVTELSKYEFFKLLGKGWKYKSHKVLDFSGQRFKLTTLRGTSNGLLNKYLNLSEIETIDLSNNDLVSLEDIFSLDDSLRFYSLINLNLMGNKISKFENPISLPYLIKLNISSNNLSELPDLTCLENLMYLNLSNNNIQINGSRKEAWKNISKCTKLRRLDLSYNNISISPSILGRLALMFKNSLTEFSIQGNPFCSIFPEYQSLIISCLPKLKYFNGRELTDLQRKRNMNFNFDLMDNYDDVYDLRQGSRYDATKILELGNIRSTNYGRIDILIELLEYLIDEGPSIQLCANILQGSETIYNETMKPWTTDYGGDLGDIDPFEARRFINLFSPSARLPSDRARETERFLELFALAIDRQEENPITQNSDFCKIWLLTALVRLIHIPAGGLAIGVSRLLGGLMNKKDVQSEVSYIISTLVFPALKGRQFSDPIVQTVFASVSILPHSRLLAMALNDHMGLILNYTSSYVRTEFHKPLMSILALVSLYKDNAIILSGYGVPTDLAGTLITLYLYSTPANINKGGFGEMGNQGQSLTVNRPKNEPFFKWSSTEHILSDQALDYISREISASGQLGRGDSFSIHKIAKLLSKKRNKQQTIYKGKQKETLNLNILPDFVKFTDFQQALIIFYLKIIRNCCLASEKASKACVDLGLHSNFLMPILSEFLSSGLTSKFDEKTSILCSEVIQTVNCFVESSKVALMQMIVNFHLIDWMLIPIKETPFGDPDVVFACMSTLLSICNRSEQVESIQYTPISESSSLIGKALNIYNGNIPLGTQFRIFGNGESFQVLNYIIQQMDFLNPQLEFLNGNQYFREMVSFYSSNIEDSNSSLKDSLEILKNANSDKVQKSIQAILNMIVFLFQNKTIGICSKVIEEIYRRGYCILFMRLLEIPGESVPISAIQILSMIDITEMDTISINELLRLLKIESLNKDSVKKSGSGDELALSESKDITSAENDLAFNILGPLWTHILNYIRRLINNKGSSNWYIFKETFAKDIGLIIFSGLKYSWNQFILNSPFKLVVNHLSNVNEVQIQDMFSILSSSRVIRALSRYKGFREYLRTPEIQSIFEYSLKKEEKYFAAFDPDTALEISWPGRSVDILLGTFKGQNRLSSSKKVAVRVLCRLADVLTGVSDEELFELEKSQLDYTLQFKKKTNSLIEGISTLESNFMNIISRESSMWDLTLEPFIEQLLFLDEMEFSDKLIQDEMFVEADGIIRVYLFLSNLIDDEFRDTKENSNNLIESFDNKKSIISTANTWAGILKGSIIIKEKRVSEKIEEEEDDDDEDEYDDDNAENEMDGENKGWRSIFNLKSNKEIGEGLEDHNIEDETGLPVLSGSDDQESLLYLSDSDVEIEEIADLDYEANPNEETIIIHPRARNIVHGVYNKYGPLTTGSIENDLKVSSSFIFDNIGGANSSNSISLTSTSLSSSEAVKAQNKLEGSGSVWKNIISATVNNHLAVAAFLRIIFVSIKSNTSLKLRNYAKKVMMKPYVLDGTAKLVLSCGILESHVASKFLIILSEIFELETNTNAASMDLLIPLYIGFWFINSILDTIVYILQQATKRHLKPEEQLLCTSLCKAIYSMLDSLGNIQFSRTESINEYGLEKSIRYFISPLLLNCLEQMVLFDIQVSIGSSHGSYMAHIPLMFSRKYILGKKEEMPETIIKLRELMRQYSSKSLSLLMEKSSKYRYYVVEGFTFQTIFRHFPLRRSFMFELMEHVNTLHFSKGVELFLSYYYERNERIIGVYPCYVFIQTKELRDYVKKEKKNKDSKHSDKKGNDISAGIAKYTGIDLSKVLGDNSDNEDPGPPPSIRSVLILTTNAYYIFERPKTVRNVVSTEQFKYKEDPIAIIKREYSDLKRIVRSFLGEQSAMLGWNCNSHYKSQNDKKLENIDETKEYNFTWRNTIYDIIIFDKIEDRDEMLNRIRKKSAEFLSMPLNIYNDFVSRSCLSHLLRIENVRAIQFALGEKIKPDEIKNPKIDKLYSLRPPDVKKKKFFIDEMIDTVSDLIFPPKRKSRFPIAPYPRAAILHDAEKAQLKLYVITINSVYEFLVDWRFWFCPDSNMLETGEDLYFRREMVIPPNVEISSLKEVNDDISGIQKRGLMNFLGILDKIPNQNVNIYGSELQDNDNETKDNKNENNKNSKTTKTNKEKIESKSIGISLKNFRSEFSTWYETRLKLAKENLFQKLRVFRIHRLRIAQFGPLEEPEVKLVYQLCPKKKKKRKKSKNKREMSKKDTENDAKTKNLKPTSSDEDPLLESDESDGDISDSKDATSKERKKLSRLTSLQIIFLDDSARERFKIGIAIVINELENSNDWKRRMVPVLNPPNLNKVQQKNYKNDKSVFSSFLL
ncbi:leucine-rich repeat-containing protein [Cryptosporidium ubiquitum]|uniref:Leucine-rich repeat-containing protein n=1 Tax=Cryptosporidium ubiquitum TaxID=857276 RepID=A0A1J4MAP0_9CRYT|nr:leucine-rich repeat-containing protein [Cryptosporidium ubiquitum]OII71296.1 leucine-rich repeat-containing protein [Cryptosporidium ubiquitum]